MEAAPKIGAFYWVMPVVDVDLVLTAEDLGGVAEDSPEYYGKHFDHWTQQLQPARYAGQDDTGREMWWYLGQEGDGPHGAQAWPIRWRGQEITPPHG